MTTRLFKVTAEDGRAIHGGSGKAVFCRCGCGELAPRAQRNNASRGHIKGEPLPFRSGHNGRGRADLSRYVIAPSGCWEWTGSLDHKGYGRVQVDRVHRQAHRVIYERVVGPVGHALHLDHLCRNRACVNPNHLEPVTPGENTRRSYASRRALNGDLS